MIGRAAGILTAITITVVAVTITLALIVYDLFGSEFMQTAWKSVRTAQQAHADQSGLDRARDFTFFTSTPIKSHGFEITTGVRFATLKDLLAGRQQDRWCYVMIQPKGGVPRQITLATQKGTAAPAFNDMSAYPEAELRTLGVSARALEGIARAQCRFCCEDGQTATAGECESSAGRSVRA